MHGPAEKAHAVVCDNIAHAPASATERYESTSGTTTSIVSRAGASTATAPPPPPTANAAGTATVADEAAAAAAAAAINPTRKIGGTQLTLWRRGTRIGNYSTSRIRLLDACGLKRLRALYEKSRLRRHRRELDTPSARTRIMNEDVPWLDQEYNPMVLELNFDRVVVERLTRTLRMAVATGAMSNDIQEVHFAVTSAHMPAQYNATRTRAYTAYAHMTIRDAQMRRADPHRLFALEEPLQPFDGGKGVFVVGATHAEFSRSAGDTGELLPRDVLTRGLLDERVIGVRPYDCVTRSNTSIDDGPRTF